MIERADAPPVAADDAPLPTGSPNLYVRKTSRDAEPEIQVEGEVSVQPLIETVPGKVRVRMTDRLGTTGAFVHAVVRSFEKPPADLAALLGLPPEPSPSEG